MTKKIMIGKCRLCDSEDIELRMSHIVPKMFYEYVKRNSVTGGIREVNNPNKRVQDGLKVPFLCAKCEELFSKYETYFANKIFRKTIEKPKEFSFASDDDCIRYFLLSIAWRVLKYTVETDKSMLNNFSAAEYDKLLEVLNIWRKILFNEEFNELKKLQMHLIPTKSLKIFENINGIVSNNVGIDFRTFDNQDTFEYAFTYVKVPYFIFLCTVWGSTSSMKQFKVGNTIKPRISNLPNFIEKVIISHFQDFNVSKQEISSKQIESIIERSK